MIRTVGGSDSPTAVSRILQDHTGHRVEVVAWIAYPLSPAMQECVLLEVHDLGQAAPEQDAEFWTQRDYEEPPEARSLAPPSWGVICPHCGMRLHVRHSNHQGDIVPCGACGGLLRIPAGALTAAEARSRPTEAKP